MMQSWARPEPVPVPDGSGPSLSKSDILRGFITERLSSAARDILAVVERTVADYEEEASGFRQEIARQRRQLELLLPPQVKEEAPDDQLLFPVCEAGGGEPPEEEEEQQKYEPSVVDSWSLGIHSYEEPLEDEEDVEEEELSEGSALSCVQDRFTDPDYEAASRAGRPRLSEPPSLVGLRIRILDDSTIDVLSTSVFRKYPVHELECPRSLREPDFLNLLRSTFPQLAAEPFDVFMTNRSRRLQPLRANKLTPEEIYRSIRSTGNSALYIRLKRPMDLQAKEKEAHPGEDAADEDPPSCLDPTTPTTRAHPEKKKDVKSQISQPGTHLHLRIRIVEDSGIDVISPYLFRKYPVRKLLCPHGLQEADFLNLLRSTFPQLAADQPFTILASQGRMLKPLNVQSLTPEEIYRTSRSAGHPVVYIQLKPPTELQTESPQRKDAADEDPSSTANPRVQPARGTPPQTSDSSGHIDMKIRILEDSQLELVSPFAFQKYPAHVLRCPRGLQQAHFLNLLRSTFPQLAVNKRFEVFTTDRSMRLQPVTVKTLTPEGICEAVKSTGNTSIFFRLKAQREVQATAKKQQWKTVDGAEELASFSDQTRLYRRSRSSPSRPGGHRAIVLSNGSSPHRDDVETEEAEDREASEPVGFWSLQSLILTESNQATDGHDGWKPKGSTELLRSGKPKEKMTVREGVKQMRVKRKKAKQMFSLDASQCAPTDDHDAVLSCRVCRLVRGSMNMLIKHAWNHVNERERLCGVCGEQPESAEELRSHLQTHQKTHNCNFCGKSFLTVIGFKGHLARHTGDQPYRCRICHKAFTEKSVLKTHEWVHQTDKPHKCDICQKSYISDRKLKVHRLTHMVGKPYSCNLCGKHFRSMDSLSQHMLLHSDPKAVRDGQYFCQICNKTFSTQKKLQLHVKYHNNERPFGCTKCSKTFVCRSNLVTHMRVHTGEKPYKCPVCGMGFSQSHCVKRHLATHRVKELSPINGAAY